MTGTPNTGRPVRVRFAPSPTGPLHLGGARTALFNWLYARNRGGTFILRIENTDAVRSSEAHEESILSDLHWLGLDWEEGPKVGGPYGPYRQDERVEIHRKALEQLQQDGAIYPCFCSLEQIETTRRQQMERGEPPRYPGTCRGLDPDVARERLEQGQKHTWRFALPAREYIVRDLIRGEVKFDLAGLGDFVVMRTDGTFPYLFASAVDDARMQISHVLRGEDGLSNAPRQAVLIEALGEEPPVFGHLPLLLDPDGKKLAKRDPSFTLEALRERQVPPEALFFYLAGLGYAPAAKGDLSKEELIETFDLSKVARSPARVDASALEHVAGRHVRDLPQEEFVRQARERLADVGITYPETQILDEAIAGAFQTDVRDWRELEAAARELEEGWTDVAEEEREVFGEETALRVLRVAAGVNEEVPTEDWCGETLIGALRKEVSEVKGRKLYGPLRVALTGKLGGPELKHLITLLGRERVRERVSRALAQLHQDD